LTERRKGIWSSGEGDDRENRGVKSVNGKMFEPSALQLYSRSRELEERRERKTQHVEKKKEKKYIKMN